MGGFDAESTLKVVYDPILDKDWNELPATQELWNENTL